MRGLTARLLIALLSVTAAPGWPAVYRVPLLPPASDGPVREGFVRVVNRSQQAGEIAIVAIDDAGMRIEGTALAIDAGETVHFNSSSLEYGDPGKGLSGGTGAGHGDWRLELDTDLDIEVLAYVRTEDGFVTAMHDVVAAGPAGHRVATFNPGRNDRQQSLLRLINPSMQAVQVTISGVDDAGKASAGEVRVELPAGGARTLSAAALESAALRTQANAGRQSEIQGEIGSGTGKWQLQVTGERPIVVMSLLSSPTGHLTNLSTTPYRAAEAGSVNRQVAEDAPAGVAIGDPVTADFGAQAALTHTLDGPDADAFDIDAPSGQLLTREPPIYDFETRPVLEVLVRVTDGLGGVVRIPVTVEVIDVDEPPGQPPPPEVEGISSRSVRVTWDEPQNTGPPIDGYDVEYRRPGAAEYTDAEHGGTGRELVIEYLRQRTDYEFRVRALNAEGIGAWSDPTTGRARSGGGGGGGGGGTVTPPPPPPPPPPPTGNHAPTFAAPSRTFDLTEGFALGEAVGAAVAADDQDGDPLTYSLEGADARHFDIDAATGQVRTWTGVRYDYESQARYDLQVNVDDGRGGTAATAVVVELQDVVERPLAPEAPTVKANAATELQVTWEAPANSGRPAITGYDVEYRTGGGSFNDAGFSGSDTQTTITGLAADTGHEVQVRARNADGDGSWSPLGEGTTTVATPTVTSLSFVSDPGSDDTYKERFWIEAGVRFSEPVAVDTSGGTPQIGLTLGSTPRIASFVRGSGNRVLVFRYRVQADDEDTDGVAIPANGLALQGGTIRQVDSTVDATLTHVALADQSGHKVNGAETDAKPSGVVRTFAYHASSPYADDLAPCTYHGSDTVACTFGRLPYLGADTDTPTLDDVMNRVVVSHRWMGANFRNLLERMPSYLLPLFRSIRAVVIANDIRPAFHSASRGAIYIDPDFVYLTPEQQAVVSDEPDYRRAFGLDLKYRFYWRPVNADGRLRIRRAADGSRVVETLVPFLGFLLLHELAHAADWMTPGRIGSLESTQKPTDVASNDLSKGLTAALPLASDVLRDLADVQFFGHDPTAQQLALRPRHVGAEFAGDQAVDYYAYSTIREDLADLFHTAMMGYAFGYETAIAFTAVPESGERNDAVVVWGQRGRIADARVLARARMVVEGVFGNRQSVISAVQAHLGGLPSPRAMQAGKTFGELTDPPSGRGLTPKLKRLDQAEDEDILERNWIE